MKKLVLVIVCWFYFVVPAQAASFDCSKAASKIEKIICGDGELSQLDEAMSNAYKQTLERSDYRYSATTRQKEWLKDVRNRCQSADCIKQAYQSRIRELKEDLLVAEPIPSLAVQGPWLRLYADRVENIAVDAEYYQPGQPIPLDAVIVLLRDYQPYLPHASALIVPRPSVSQRTEKRIESYLTGESWPEGCLYWHLNPELEPEPGRIENQICQQLRKKAVIKFKNEIEACSKTMVGDIYMPNIFVEANLGHTRCLLTQPFERQWLDPLPQSDRWVLSKMEMNRDLDSGGHAYLNLETNRLFGCESYGLPISYWRKKLSTEEALQERKRQMDYPFYLEKPTWQKQYLIKTGGFRDVCWGAPRLIDEPENVSIRLNDGTVLLRGNRSILRVREKDGSTEAPTSLVKVFDPAFVRQVLDVHGANKCTGESLAGGNCQLLADLGWEMPDGTTAYYRMVIKAVDTVLQDLLKKSH